MLSVDNIPERLPPILLGHYRGVPASAPFAIDASRHTTRAERAFSARASAYPSPPMSGSPHLPPKGPQEASDRGLAQPPYLNTQDVRRRSLTQPLDPRDQLSSPLSASQPYLQEQLGAMAYPYRRPEHSLPRITTLAQPPLPHGLHHPGMYQSLPGPSNVPPYPSPSQSTTVETQMVTSPTSQRKTKGHVASACVPCKRAHLRCDAQRPCSRCISNGKEESCIDVKHKKRGRPRLRDDRETRYDPSRFPNPHDVSIRRPLNIYPSGDSGSAGYGDPLRRNSLYRVLKVQPSESMTPRFLDTASMADANVYPAPRPIVSRIPPEPVAYLTLDMEFSKASPTFLDALGGANVVGRKLADIVAPNETERVQNIRNQILNEQKRRGPNYLPPILGRGDQIIQAMGFSAEDVARFQVDHQEYLTFVADGHARPYHLRLGLAEEGSFYFVVMMLSHPYPTSGPAPGLEPERHRMDATALPRQGPAMISPGFSPGGSHYVASSSRSYSISGRSLPPTTQNPPQPSFHLPPIRAQPGPAESFAPQDSRRPERSGRVDIEGLLDKPDGQR